MSSKQDLVIDDSVIASPSVIDRATFAINRYYSTAETDPLVTGQLYERSRGAGPNHRWLYGGRTSGQWGLHEFSTGIPGDVGVDVGLLGERSYTIDGRQEVFDDGIPQNWYLPSTPIKWYKPTDADYYDLKKQQPAVCQKALHTLQVPDHDPPHP